MFSTPYKRYVLSLLTGVYTLNFVDRGVTALLLQPIKAEFQLTDTQLGFITGIAFAIFYSTVGIPMARWADRGNRVTITSIAIALWGMTVMVCLSVTSFTQLVFARVAAAVGEAGCAPPTYSILGDYFPKPAERTRAMACFWLANPLSAMISFVAAGWLNERVGWRMTFFLIGIPGLIMAAVVKVTVREPRTQSNFAAGSPMPLPQMRVVFRTLWHQGSSRHLCVAIVLLLTMGLGLAPWYAAFMVRSHQMGTAQLGLWMGLIFGLGGTIGILVGGYVGAERLVNEEQTQLRWCALATAALVPCFVAFLLVPQNVLALLALAPVAIVGNVFFASTFALMQRLVPPDMRATTLAVVMLLGNLIGMGLGPQLVGILSDALLPSLGRDSLRYAMLLVSCVALWSAWHFWIAGRTIKQDLSAIERHGVIRDPKAATTTGTAYRLS